MNWKVTKLRQFEDMHSIWVNPDNDRAASILTIFEYLTGKKPQSLSLKQLHRWSKLNAWIEEYPTNINQWVWCKGLYKITLNPSDLVGDDFTTIASYLAEGLPKALPEVMAKLCRPVLFGEKDFVKRVATFRNHMTVWQAYGTAVFFYRLWTLLRESGQVYSQKKTLNPNSNP